MTRQSHFAAIGQGKDDIKEFGVYNEDLQQLTQWFLDNQNCSYGKHRHLLAAFIYHFTGCGFQGYFMQWKVYQKYQGQKDRCNGCTMDSKTAYHPYGTKLLSSFMRF